MPNIPNSIYYDGQLAFPTGMTKVDIASGKVVYEYITVNGKRVYRSEDGTVLQEGN